MQFTVRSAIPNLDKRENDVTVGCVFQTFGAVTTQMGAAKMRQVKNS